MTTIKEAQEIIRHELPSEMDKILKRTIKDISKKKSCVNKQTTEVKQNGNVKR